MKRCTFSLLRFNSYITIMSLHNGIYRCKTKSMPGFLCRKERIKNTGQDLFRNTMPLIRDRNMYIFRIDRRNFRWKFYGTDIFSLNNQFSSMWHSLLSIYYDIVNYLCNLIFITVAHKYFIINYNIRFYV